MRYSSFVFIISVIFFSTLFVVIKPYDTTGILHGQYIFTLSLTTLAVFLFQYYFRRRFGEVFGEIDRYIFLLMLAFLDYKETDDEKKISLLKSIFKSYSEKQIIRLYNRYKDKTIRVENLCLKLKPVETRTKIFILYSLFNIASFDRSLNKEESDYILNISKLLRIPKQTFETVKNIYVKKGLTDEEEIKREQERKKFNKQFLNFLLPYEAYRIMGVSPSVTKAQLKKAYRTLAKKYHPDKYVGKSETDIQKAEEKFQEIKEAYDIIKKAKDLNEK